MRLLMLRSNQKMKENPEEIVPLLLRRGVDIKAKDDNGLTAFHHLFATYRKDKIIEIIQLLIQNGVDVKAETNDGVTALHYVCQYQKENLIEIMRLLIDHGADVNAKDDDGSTALHRLCDDNYKKENLIDIIRLFIEHGVNVKETNALRFTVGFYVNRYYHKKNKYEILKLLESI